jgi:hypothetical protein
LLILNSFMAVFLRVVVIRHHYGGTSMMSTLHKSLTIAFLAVSISISGINVDFVGAQNTAVIKATSRRSADPLLSRYLRFDRLTTEDGLSSDQAYHVAQDGYGFMWFATANGLSRCEFPDPRRFSSGGKHECSHG